MLFNFLVCYLNLYFKKFYFNFYCYISLFLTVFDLILYTMCITINAFISTLLLLIFSDFFLLNLPHSFVFKTFVALHLFKNRPTANSYRFLTEYPNFMFLFEWSHTPWFREEAFLEIGKSSIIDCIPIKIGAIRKRCLITFQSSNQSIIVCWMYKYVILSFAH